jgi:hypothetical protein
MIENMISAPFLHQEDESTCNALWNNLRENDMATWIGVNCSFYEERRGTTNVKQVMQEVT